MIHKLGFTSPVFRLRQPHFTSTMFCFFPHNDKIREQLNSRYWSLILRTGSPVESVCQIYSSVSVSEISVHQSFFAMLILYFWYIRGYLSE